MSKTVWLVEYEKSDDLGGGQWFEVVDSGGGRTLWRPQNCSEQSLLEAKKAAYMQAAAPELYEALDEVVRISDRDHDAWKRAKAALAKARGEE